MGRCRYLKKFKILTTIALDEHQKHSARQLLNLFFIGRPMFNGLTEPPTASHKEAHHTLNQCRGVALEVGLKTDGNYEIIRVIQK